MKASEVNPSKVLLIGNSDGIGLAATKRLLAAGRQVTGISRSASRIADIRYGHHVMDVGDPRYSKFLNEMLSDCRLDLCIYLAGIGELLDPLDMGSEASVIDVNLTGMVRTASAVIPVMVKQGKGHFIGVSSLADDFVSAEAPSYHASKAGFTICLGGLARALAPRGVHVTNVRFGFVDTKMAKGEKKPFMMSVEKAVDHLEICIRKKPAVYSAPKAMVWLLRMHKLMMAIAG